MSQLWSDLHFLRPLWFWALPALPALWWIGGRRRRRAAVWRKAVDPHLLPQLLESSGAGRVNWAPLFRTLGFLMAVVALTGPSWHQTEQPLWQTEQPLVIALDLSSGMSATDLPPSRLVRAKGKLAALLRDRSGGQTGLVVWADDAFTVAPLTEDAANVGLFLDALSPSIMPVDGQRPDRAIAWSAKLLMQAGFAQGEILLLTDRASVAAATAASAARQQGYRVSVLGVGPAGGGVNGVDMVGLRALSQAGGGAYATISVNDSDLRGLGLLDSPIADVGGTASGENSRVWQDQGYLLLPALMLWVLPLFRRGTVLPAILLACWLWQPALPASAAEQGGWWQRADQVRQRQLDRGVESYRKGDYAAAEQAFRSVEDAEGCYNLGNALARQGKYDDAITAYDQALEVRPGLEDARHNRDLVEAARESQSSSPQKDSSQPQSQTQSQPSSQPSSQQEDSGNGQPSSSGSNDQPQPERSTDQSESGESGGDSQQPQSRPDSDGDDPQSSSPSAGQQGQEHDDGRMDNRSQSRDGSSSPAPSSSPEDQEQQAAADAEQRRHMQQALQENGSSTSEQNPAQAHDTGMPVESAEEREQRQAREAWLQRVPDDPGGLLRTKFRLEYERRRRAGNE